MISLGIGWMDEDEAIKILKELKDEEEHLACLSIEHHAPEYRKYHMKRMDALRMAIKSQSSLRRT